MKTERQSNVELLRILAAMAVVVLHYINPVVGGGLDYVQKAGAVPNRYMMLAIESLLICAVNVFIMISGYFMCESRKTDFWKCIQLLFQTVLFSAILKIAGCVVHHNPLSLSLVLSTLVPKNYFVILYCCVYIVAPYINLLMKRLNMQALKRMVIILMLLFSVYPTLIDALSNVTGKDTTSMSTIGMYGSQWGYTIINFMLMYILGAYLRISDSGIKGWGKGKLVSGIITCTACLVVWNQTIDSNSSFFATSSWEYCNPIVVFEAILMLELFLRFKIGSRKYINSLAKASFTTFLLHGAFLRYLRIEKYAVQAPLVMLLHVLISAIGIYIICYAVHLVYDMITRRFFTALSRKLDLTYVLPDS